MREVFLANPFVAHAAILREKCRMSSTHQAPEPKGQWAAWLPGYRFRFLFASFIGLMLVAPSAAHPRQRILVASLFVLNLLAVGYETQGFTRLWVNFTWRCWLRGLSPCSSCARRKVEVGAYFSHRVS